MKFQAPIASRRTGTRALAFETLESRQLMAVTTSLNSGTLTITGDATADDIAVVGTANAGEITITGRNGTSVNGTPDGSATVPGVTGSLILNLGDGENVLNVDNVYVAGLIEITTGSVNDLVILGATSPVSPAFDLRIRTGAGNDVLREENYNVLVNGIHSVNTGDGHDAVTLEGASANSSILTDLGKGDNSFHGTGLTSRTSIQVAAGWHESPGEGGNSIAVLSSYAQSQLLLFVMGGTSHLYLDTVYSKLFTVTTAELNTSPVLLNVFRCLSDEVWISCGAGDEQINLYSNQFPIEIGTGGGNDTVDLRYNVVPQYARVHLGNSNDTLIATGNWAPEPSHVSFDGGLGGNLLTLSGNLFPQLSTSNFTS